MSLLFVSWETTANDNDPDHDHLVATMAAAKKQGEVLSCWIWSLTYASKKGGTLALFFGAKGMRTRLHAGVQGGSLSQISKWRENFRHYCTIVSFSVSWICSFICSFRVHVSSSNLSEALPSQIQGLCVWRRSTMDKVYDWRRYLVFSRHYVAPTKQLSKRNEKKKTITTNLNNLGGRTSRRNFEIIVEVLTTNFKIRVLSSSWVWDNMK